MANDAKSAEVAVDEAGDAKSAEVAEVGVVVDVASNIKAGVADAIVKSEYADDSDDDNQIIARSHHQARGAEVITKTSSPHHHRGAEAIIGITAVLLLLLSAPAVAALSYSLLQLHRGHPQSPSPTSAWASTAGALPVPYYQNRPCKSPSRLLGITPLRPRHHGAGAFSSISLPPQSHHQARGAGAITKTSSLHPHRGA